MYTSTIRAMGQRAIAKRLTSGVNVNHLKFIGSMSRPNIPIHQWPSVSLAASPAKNLANSRGLVLMGKLPAARSAVSRESPNSQADV